ncbi:hypothetical protein PV394_03915 [Streptomyces sp. NE06-03E]|uniref:hypothetical protein n=1 Tax=unclassified Streptomyces TaxID=2593676 RepID=UPI0029B0FA01|nr:MULTISPECIES: hypothetical protein [unclassified Streptomyces]MDX3054291.1 hypothetical protein [Streptomyces sp. NE06-03E]
MNRSAAFEAEVETLDLDETGWLLDSNNGEPVPHHRLREHFAEHVAPPATATDLFVYVHGWQTSPQSALRTARRLMGLAAHRLATGREGYPALAAGFEPWCVVVRWPSSSAISPAGYRRIRDRAHAMGARDGAGHAAHILGRLLGYLDAERADPAAAPVLANRDGQYLHLVGHSFGCRFLCEAVQWAAGARLGDTLGWHAAMPLSSRPFTADSMLLFQMAAGRDAFLSLFPHMLAGHGHDGAPLRGPVVTTYSRHDRAAGFWHLRAERQSGIGHSGIGPAPAPMFTTRLLPLEKRYRHADLDHVFVNIDASDTYVRGRRLNPAGAHSDHIRPESAHLLLTLADFSR